MGDLAIGAASFAVGDTVDPSPNFPDGELNPFLVSPVQLPVSPSPAWGTETES